MVKNPKILAFTVIESIFIIAALVVIALILGGLYLKSAKLPLPHDSGEAKASQVDSVDSPSESGQ